jgi:23S rRNA (pseudouridine1915-N3)-methyltransferase
MNIKLISIGKTDDKSLDILIQTYTKRLKHYINFEFVIIPDIKNRKHLNFEQQKAQEGQLLLKNIQTSDFVVLLDENGKNFTSVEFSNYLSKKMLSGTKQLVFIIGGPYGFSEKVYQRANQKISLSKMTFSHQMVRLFFVEQLYRAFTILKNEPYHHQ